MVMRDYNSVAAATFLALVVSCPLGAQPCPPMVGRVAAAVASLDGLGELEVPCQQLTRDELEVRLRDALQRELDAPLELEVEALLRIGVLDGEDATTVTRSVLDFYVSQVLGLYDASARQMVVVEGAGGDIGAEMVFAHELEHAAQDIRFGLPGKVEMLAGDGDAQRAAAAVAEGEAIVVMVEVMSGGGRLEAADLDAGTGELLANLGALQPDLPGVPRFLVAETLFPYTEGTRLVVEALQRGGWGAVEALMRQPPLSTEQILHPERHADPPRVVRDSELPLLPAQFEVVHRDVLGEWGLRTWLEGALPAAAAAAAAAGWDGDILRVSRRVEYDAWRMDWVSLWDSPGEAEEAASWLRAALPKLLGRLGPRGADLLVRSDRERVVVVATGRPDPA